MAAAADPARFYTGLTSNVRLRLADHNGGRCRHTTNGRPWRVIVVVALQREIGAWILQVTGSQLR